MRFFLLSGTLLTSLFAGEGLIYRHIDDRSSQSIHLIEIDPSLYEIKPIKALDNGIGRESVLSISTRYKALASVNGGFFAIGGTLDGKACGTLKIGDWYALPTKPRGCIGWSEVEQNPKMDQLIVSQTAYYEDKYIPLDGLNCGRKKTQIILFTPSFHRTTLTNRDGEEVTVVDGIITSIVKGGSSKIPENGFVLSIQENHPLFHTFEVGKSLTIITNIESMTGITRREDWKSLDYIVGGAPLLIFDSTKVTNFTLEEIVPNFLSKRHSRTAVGLLPNGNWIFVVVDKTEFFDGMTINELTDLMADLGCVYALNLDGGGSSTMVYEGDIKNCPHGDEDEGAGQNTVRRVSDAIIVLPKNEKGLERLPSCNPIPSGVGKAAN